MPVRPASPASVILEVISRTCGLPVRDHHKIQNDLHLGRAERMELRVALELALRCELGDFEIDGGITVADLIEELIERSKVA